MRLRLIVCCAMMLSILSGCGLENVYDEGEGSLYSNTKSDYLLSSFDIKQTEVAYRDSFVTLNLTGPENSGITFNDEDTNEYTLDLGDTPAISNGGSKEGDSTSTTLINGKLKASVTDNGTTIKLKQRAEFEITESDKQWLYACTMAEAGGQGLYGMILVADVIITRAIKYNSTCKAIITSPNQFSTYSNGAIAKYMRGGISDECKKACDYAVAGADYSKGAYYFNSIGPNVNGTFLFRWKGHFFAK